MASDIWLKTILVTRGKTFCHHITDYSFWLAARDILYALSGIFLGYFLTDYIFSFQLIKSDSN